MSEHKVRSSQHVRLRAVLRVGGPLIAVAGLIFLFVGVGSFLSRFGTAGPSAYFWCVFLGLLLLFIGLAMCQFAYFGAVYRYVAGEAAPITKNVVNYMGESVQPGVKAMAKAVADGVIEGQKSQPEKP